MAKPFKPTSKINQMKPIANLFLLILMFFYVGCSSSDSGRTSSVQVAALDSIMNTTPEFNGVVLVADQGTPVFFKAYGYRDMLAKTPLDTGDIFELASISKTFTATLILMLKDEGKLDLNDPLEKYFPSTPYHGINLRHLLTHTSGLPDYQEVMDLHWDKSRVAGNEECIQYLFSQKPPVLFEPGAKYTYSNTGYLLLGSIIEMVSGVEFSLLLQQRIFRPLGMKETELRSRADKTMLSNFAYGYMKRDSSEIFMPADSFPSSNYTIWLGNRKGPGRVSSTARDLLRWDQGLYEQRFIDSGSIQLAYQPEKLNDGQLSNYGLGWELESYGGIPTVGHSGSNPGYKTHLIRDLKNQRTVIVLTNNTFGQIPELLNRIMHSFQNK
jgi:CubicO group peptidase (beta-lactamase class C family)